VLLDPTERTKQVVRVPPRLRNDDRVEVGGSLVVDPVRFERRGLVQARDGDEFDAVELRDLAYRVEDGELAFTEVASQSDDGAGHARSPAGLVGPERARMIVTDTSSNGTVIGALGLCTVTFTNCASS